MQDSARLFADHCATLRCAHVGESDVVELYVCLDQSDAESAAFVCPTIGDSDGAECECLFHKLCRCGRTLNEHSTAKMGCHEKHSTTASADLASVTHSNTHAVACAHGLTCALVKVGPFDEQTLDEPQGEAAT